MSPTEPIATAALSLGPLRVPREDGAVLIRPDRERCLALLASNAERLQAATGTLQGRPLNQLRQQARREALQTACRFTQHLLGRDLPFPASHTIVVGGHQPALFHPGVWLKNFALDWLARRSGGAAIHLIVDNDMLASVQVRVPQGPPDQLRLVHVPLDTDHAAQPWEEVVVQNAATFRSFGDRLAGAAADWDLEPVAAEFWPAAVDALRRTSRLADCLAAGRNHLERCWGANNLELPISQLSQLEAFRLFFCHIVAHLPRFLEVHNRMLERYRRRNKLRSRTHPVPELKEADGWREAPFWVWRAGDQTRRRLFARTQKDAVELHDGERPFARLPVRPDQDAPDALAVLDQLERDGVRLRPRALTTTMFARLLLADLFVHGIGGAKYDELTDEIIAEFFGLEPPALMAVSGTLHLPGPPAYDVSEADRTELHRLLRDLAFNPQRHLQRGVHPEADRWIAEKERLIAEQHAARTSGLSRSQRRQRRQANAERYRKFQQVNACLAPFVADRRREIEQKLADVDRQLRANAILQDREYSFCLYPAEKLRAFVSVFLDQ